MAVQTARLECNSFAFLDKKKPNTNQHGKSSYTWDYTVSPELLLAFNSPASNINRYRVTGSEVCIRFAWSVSYSSGFKLTTVNWVAGFDEETVTYNTSPASNYPAYESETVYGDDKNVYIASNFVAKYGYQIRGLKAPSFKVNPGSNVSATTVYSHLAASGYRPYVLVYYDDSDIIGSSIKVANAPTSGYLNPRNSQTFAWDYDLAEENACLAETVIQASATFYWREGSSGDYTAVAISGNTKSITIPANTFPINSSIEWYVEGTDDYGITSQTAVYTLSTAAALVYSTPVQPVGSVEDGSAAIQFEWTYQSSDGFPATGYDILYRRASDSTFTRLARSEDSSETSYTLAADSLSAGEYVWRVNIKNIDGEWSTGNTTAQFIVVAAPPRPSVTVEPIPFAIVSWQVEGQQAYRITVDGTVYGPYFGSGKSWTVPDYLPDGEHTITVEVQGVYGLWSQPGSASFTVQNQPGDAVTLSGEFDRDADLSWETTSQTADFLVYRDGVQIGHASALSFSDRTVLGEHSYQVINRLPSGNYTASNVVSGTMISCVAAIAPLSGGDWIELTLSENSNREESFTWTQAVSMRHFAGAEYPVAEQSPFADQSGSYDVAFKDLPSAKAFEALRGQAVILKSRGGNVMIGILSTLSKRMTEFYIVYTFTLQRMHWRDFIDADSQL